MSVFVFTLYLTIITPNKKKMSKSSFTLLCFIKILTIFFQIYELLYINPKPKKLKYPAVKRTTTKIRGNPTVTWWRDVERECAEDEWQGLGNNLWKTFEEVLGFETKVSKREWFDTDSERAIGENEWSM